MGAALVLLLVGLGALAAGVLIGRYYVPDDRQLRRTARHGRAFMRALTHLIARDHDTVVTELRGVVEENIDDVEPYFALGAMFRSRGEHERAIRVHQALAVREREKKKLRTRAMYELGMDFRAAGMPRRATRAMEEVLIEEPGHEGALRSLAALYEEQARFAEAAELWQRIGQRRGDDTSEREHHLYVAAAQAAIARGELDVAKERLKLAQRLAGGASAHFFAAAAELAAARGNWRGTRERIRQALVADPGIAVQVLPLLIAAEEGLGVAPASEAVALATPSDELVDAESQSQSQSQSKSESLALTATATATSGEPDGTHALVPAHAAPTSVTERVLALLDQIAQQTGPRLELDLIRAQLSGPDRAADLSRELTTRFPDALATRVAAARLALGADDAARREALDALAGESGALAWALRGRWQCTHCHARPAAFSWRCGQCRRWGTLAIETGIEPPLLPPRERRAAPRAARPELLLGAAPDSVPVLEAPTDDDLGLITGRRSLLGRVGGWMSGVWRRGAP